VNFAMGQTDKTLVPYMYCNLYDNKNRFYKLVNEPLQVFGLTSYLAKERSYLVWEATIQGFGYLDSMLQRTVAYGVFKVEDLF
jgi:hypothetical protein